MAYTGGTTRTDTFAYTPGGHTSSRTVDGVTQALTWDAEGRLATTSEPDLDTSYVYDTSGNRLLRRDTTGATLYLGHTELRRTASNGQVDGTRHYQHAGATVAVRTVTGLTWLIPDHHGTNQISIDPATHDLTRRRTLPFGDTRGAVPSLWPDDKGFVGGTKDPTGLTHIGARQYDPALGRFISVDPLVNPGDPQTLNGYAYGNNNPTSFSDPTGLAFLEGNGGAYGEGRKTRPGSTPGNRKTTAGTPLVMPLKGASGHTSDATSGTPAPAPLPPPIPVDCLPADRCRPIEVDLATSFVPFVDLPDCLGGSKIACFFVGVDAAGGKIAGGIIGFGLLTAKRIGRLGYVGRGVWDLPWRQRGFEVERIILADRGRPGFAVNNHPRIDDFSFHSGDALSVKSVDTELGFKKPGALQGELRRYVRALEKYRGGTHAGVTVDPRDIKSRTLAVGIPSGTVTEVQYAAMLDAVRYGRDRNINVEFVIVR
ncbi:RHS repeat-associated core domain-containing protein [Solwaraspora sp. WMMA2101]|uniref:RHS repeat-associated core domain-containing protein n=1 Tax=Solwaraspora sp. WMMA2101 TaxID=3404124 RepID=UPI003B9560FB